MTFFQKISTILDNFDNFRQFLIVFTFLTIFETFETFDKFWQFWQFVDNLFWQFLTSLTIFNNVDHFDNWKDNPGDLWHLRHWLQFWQLRTWIHDNLCYLTLNCDTGQHSQFLRCLSFKLKSQFSIFDFYCVLQIVQMVSSNWVKL